MGSSTCFEALIRNQQTALLLLSDKLQIVYANPSAEDLFAHSLRQMQMMTLDTLLQHSSLDCRWLQTQLSQHNSVRVSELEVSLYPHSYTLDLCAQRLEPSEKQQILLELHLVDRQLHQQFQNETQHQAQRQLLRNLAHEIKNPLGAIKGAAQLLARQLDEPRWQPYTEMLLSQSDRLSQLVDRMLGPQQNEVRQSVNLHRLLEELLTLLALDTPPGVLFVRDYDPSLPEMMVANAALQQALLNILLNARQAVLDSGIITLKTRVVTNITLSNKRYRRGVAITISDNGPGIPEHIKPHLFVPMVNGRADGCGLGLAIAQEVMTRYHGLIQWQSQPGDTRFTLYLPYSERNEA